MWKEKVRGFANMDPKLQRQIASKGGVRAHALGVAHEWTREEAQAAGRLGGRLARRRTRAVIQSDREGNFIAEFPSIKEASRVTGADESLIINCCKGRAYQTRGSQFKYKNANTTRGI
jgi:general stress protein YciG